MKLAFLVSLLTGSWTVSPGTEVRVVYDQSNGVACYVVGDGFTTFDAKGISCVKVKP